MDAQGSTIFATHLLQQRSLKRTEFSSDVCLSLRTQLQRLDLHRPLLVHDPIATEASGIQCQLMQLLFEPEDANVFDVSCPLSPSEVDELGLICRSGNFDNIVAVGGGATLDAAKLIALRSSNDRPTLTLVEGGFGASNIPIIAVPTTAGSGSEATHFAVLFVGEEKHSISHPSLRPKVAIVDPSLISSVPTKVAAAAGLDVLCQSVESLWSRRANRRSITFAAEALRLVIPNLKAAVVDKDPEAESSLCLASHLAGQAINYSFTTICHALSYRLTARYGISHGIATASTLPAAFYFNCGMMLDAEVVTMEESGITRCARELASIFDCRDVESIIKHLVLLIRSVGGAASVAELSLPQDYLPVDHAEAVNPDRLRNNPRRATTEDIVGILLRDFDHDGFSKS